MEGVVMGKIRASDGSYHYVPVDAMAHIATEWCECELDEEALKKYRVKVWLHKEVFEDIKGKKYFAKCGMLDGEKQ